MKYAIIHYNSDVKYFIKLIDMDFFKKFKEFKNGNRDDEEIILFLSICQDEGLIRIKSPQVIIYDYEDI